MARQPRSALPSVGAFHVINRGVERRPIFIDEEDYLVFASLLRRAIPRFGWTVYAWVQMPNHFHLVVIAELDRLSRGMHFVSFRCAEAFNERYDRSGHLFQGRFKAWAIEDEEDVGRVCSYVFDNPVRAGLCEPADRYRWTGGDFLELVYDLR
jgi:REP element-mobilizing transposase RayT